MMDGGCSARAEEETGTLCDRKAVAFSPTHSVPEFAPLRLNHRHTRDGQPRQHLTVTTLRLPVPIRRQWIRSAATRRSIPFTSHTASATEAATAAGYPATACPRVSPPFVEKSQPSHIIHTMCPPRPVPLLCSFTQRLVRATQEPLDALVCRVLLRVVRLRLRRDLQDGRHRRLKLVNQPADLTSDLHARGNGGSASGNRGLSS